MIDESRIETAKQIIESPDDFKVCEGCGSIVAMQTEVCPNCNAYRFDEDPTYVVEQAVKLASRAQRSVTKEDLS